MTLTLRDLLSPLASFFGGGLAGAVVSSTTTTQAVPYA